MMKRTVLTLLCFSTYVDAFSSTPQATPQADDTAAWAASPAACSTPPFWETNWDAYDMTDAQTPLCQHSSALFEEQLTPWTNMNQEALNLQTFLSKGSSENYVKLEKDLKHDLIEGEGYWYSIGWGAPFFGTNLTYLPNFTSFLEGYKTDGLIILHKGKMVYEKYWNGQTEHTRHLIFSCGKSMAGLMGEMLIELGHLSESALITDIIPEMKRSGFVGATVRDVLDMKVALQFEEYSEERGCNFTAAILNFAQMTKVDESTGKVSMSYDLNKIPPGCQSFFWTMSKGRRNQHALRWEDLASIVGGEPGTMPPYMPGPQNLREFLPTLEPNAAKKHGVWYDWSSNYKSPVTDVLEWVLDRTLKALGSSDLGATHQEYFVKKIWSQLGQDHDATVGIDPTGVAMFSADMSATLPDMARLGQVLLNGGISITSQGTQKQVIPKPVVERLRNPPLKYKEESYQNFWDEGYISQFWNGQANPYFKDYLPKNVSESVKRLYSNPPRSEPPLFFGLQGVWGQFVSIYPELDMVVARHATDAEYGAHHTDNYNAWQIAWMKLNSGVDG